jgi:hypothetical protein
MVASGGQWEVGGDGVEGGETRRPFIARRLGGDGAVTTAIPPYHGALAGARRRHGDAVEAPRVASAWGGVGLRAACGLGRRRASGGARGADVKGPTHIVLLSTTLK